MLLTLEDATIEDIISNKDCFVDSEHGEEYINTFIVELQKYDIAVKVVNNIDYVYERDYLLKVIIRNMDTITNMSAEDFLIFLNHNFEKGGKLIIERCEK